MMPLIEIHSVPLINRRDPRWLLASLINLNISPPPPRSDTVQAEVLCGQKETWGLKPITDLISQLCRRLTKLVWWRTPWL